ncbi:MAG: ATP-dependent RNA helicase [Amphiamblys sp. WSBS2006]|nr:MAG: ATP-dependent RNA helicase [Amphiamblys sp. WSBS2006]
METGDEIKTLFKYSKLFSIQKKIIANIAHRGDFCLCAPTGSGKTLAYLILLLEKLSQRVIPKTRAVILAPTPELAEQIHAVTEHVLRNTTKDIKAALLVERKQPFSKRSDILVTTPSLFSELLEKKKLGKTLRHVVFDEADFVFERKTFHFNQILGRLSQIKHKPVFDIRVQKIFVSASLDGELVRASLQLHNTLLLTKKTPPRRLKEFFAVVDEENPDEVLFEILSECHGQTLCFVNTPQETETLHEKLTTFFPNKSIVCLSENMSFEKRKCSFSKIKNGTAMIAICTDEFSRGIDVPSIGFVINVTLPTTDRAYTHRVGRAARGLSEGVCYTLIRKDEIESPVVRNRGNAVLKQPGQ